MISRHLWCSGCLVCICYWTVWLWKTPTLLIVRANSLVAYMKVIICCSTRATGELTSLYGKTAYKEEGPLLGSLRPSIMLRAPGYCKCPPTMTAKCRLALTRVQSLTSSSKPSYR